MRRFLLGWLFLCIAFGSAETRELYILHTNDIHGYIEAYEGGGLERIAGLVAQYRREHPGRVVLLDGGDTSLGTPLSGLLHGLPTAEIMDLMNYDAVVLGNHEFNWGQEKMRALTDEINTAVVCANLVALDGSPPPYPAWTVVERNGVRIGVIGLVTQETPRKTPVAYTRGWDFLDPVAATQAALVEMPEVDLVLGLTHLGWEEDKRLARGVPELDLIVGGHSHTPLHEALIENDTPIVQAGCYARYLGVLRVEVDTHEKRLRVLDYRLVPALEAEQVDPAARGIMEKYATEVRPILERQAGQVLELLDKEPSPGSYDTPLGNFVSDVFRRQTGADVAFYNRGGVRHSLPAGPLSVGKLFELFPFDDPVVMVQASGAELLKIVEQGTVSGQGPLSAGGLTALIQDGKVVEVRVGATPLDPKAEYTVATTSFVANGGDGLSAFAGLKKLRYFPFTRDVLLQDLETHSEIRSPGTGRLRALGS
ncbi:MAG: bifunctional UDP-sugar hydrolase/5'-nucleotidase [Vulcanimicrobiota bacterium]